MIDRIDRDGSISRGTYLFVVVSLVLLNLLIFVQTASHGFIILDDNDYVRNNPHVLSGLTLRNVSWAFTSFYASNWHPLTWLSHMADGQLAGPSAGWPHLHNLLLHTLSTVLLFRLLERSTGALFRSAAVAALFAVHPMHVESVAWVAERKDVLSAFFLVLTLLAYRGYAARPVLHRYLATLCCFALGLMAKPMLVTLPFLMMLFDCWPLRRIRPFAGKPGQPKELPEVSLARALWEKVPFIILSAASSALTLAAQREAAMMSLEKLPVSVRLGNAVVSYLRYLEKTFWPVKLTIFYPLSLSGMEPWRYAAAGMVLALVTVAVVVFARRAPYLPFGWFWFVGTLVPVIGLVQVGGQAMADRYSYTPHIGLFVMVVWLAGDLRGKLRLSRKNGGLLFGCAVAVLAALSFMRAAQFRDAGTLFSEAVRVDNRNYLAYTMLGISRQEAGNCQAALAAFREAAQLNPDYLEARFGAATALEQMGRKGEAMAELRSLLAAHPEYTKARLSLASDLAGSGLVDEAIAQLDAALERDPRSAVAHHNLAVAFEMKGDSGQAIYHYGKAIVLDPGYVECYGNLGDLQLARGNRAAAVESYTKALKLDPGYLPARQSLQTILSH
ncbi:tetratricopeptide repeat protein [Geomonas sp. Red32]|uniref:tetratricopeptide repeat protein n=1 Tax=Geomonas sp. Red32 TaxID=2912856 RepID=UPI00202CC4CE|nr:tetratricopeptide repeat protein [Geomonas sp. Red32]MCM0082760.1 tetratricopeptide repeat protein [Geomonas sp. Red32]